MGVLFVFRGVRVTAPDALIFRADPYMAGLVAAQGGDELPLRVAVPSERRGRRGHGQPEGSQQKPDKQEAASQRGKAGAAS